MYILALILALLVGISLGLIGSGGSILTVPILVYILQIPASTATAYSLFIVGVTALIGGIQQHVQGNVRMTIALLFGIPSIIAVYLTRLWIMPNIPAALSIGSLYIGKDSLLLVLFAIIMVLAAFSMIRPYKAKRSSYTPSPLTVTILTLLEGTLVGILTGLVGAGGGFLIIPALVLLAGIPMKEAVGTSLLIIAAKSLIGFTGDIQTQVAIDWSLLITFTIASSLGIAVGITLTQYISNEKLKPLFGYFVLCMGIMMLVQELLF